jgi:hypothetical protein
MAMAEVMEFTWRSWAAPRGFNMVEAGQAGLTRRRARETFRTLCGYGRLGAELGKHSVRLYADMRDAKMHTKCTLPAQTYYMV